MMPFPSFYPSPYYRNPYRNLKNISRPTPYSIEKQASFSKDTNFSEKKEIPKEDNKRNTESSDVASEYFEIFGLKLYFDDILLISMIFFLYNEGVQDQMLFISLILLLLS